MRAGQRAKLTAGAGLVTMLLGALMVLVPGGAGAEEPVLALPEGTVVLDGSGNVPICHASNSNTNPYILNSPSYSATGFTGAVKHAAHDGPVWDETLKAQKIEWGDIIPPISLDGVTLHYAGLNWPEGSDLYARCTGQGPAAPVVIVEKDVPGEDVDPTEFSFAVNDGEATAIDESEFIETTVAAGTVTITEDDAEGYTLTGVECTRDYVSEGEPVEDEAIADEWDGEGTSATFSAQAGDIITCTFTNTVDQQPTSSITVDKTNNANGTLPFSDSEQASAAGAAVPFQVVISNTGDTDLTLDTLTDTWAGLGTPIDLLVQEGFSCTRGGAAQSLAAGDTLPAGSVTTCTFTLTGYAPAAGGSKTNTVAVTTEEEVGDDDTSTVSTPTPQIIVIPTPPTYTIDVDKLNDANGDGEFSDGELAVAEGDDVAFWVTIRNTGTGAVTLTSMTDSFDGQVVDLLSADVDLECNDGDVTLTVGSVLAAGSTTTCTFVLEDYAPAGGEDRVNTISVDTDQATPSTDDSTVSTPEVEPSEVTVPPTTQPTPPSTVPPTTAKPAEQVLGVQVTRTLPKTGNETRDLAGLGAALIGLGAALLVASRRREGFAS